MVSLDLCRHMALAGSYQKMNAVFRTYRSFSTVRLVVLTLLGLAIGIFGNDFYREVKTRPIFNNNPPQLVYISPEYIGIQIDRTRQDYCKLHPQRILFTHMPLNGELEPLVIPLTEADYVWPQLGRSKFIVGVRVPSGLPPGKWFVQTTVNEDCSWVQWFIGGRTQINAPLPFTIPAPGSQ
jgi:hypothetical protein